MFDATTEITYHPDARAAFPLSREMWVEKGCRDDWLLLRDLHYKMHTDPVGAKYYRLRFRDETAGVLLFGMSRPLLKERHAVFPNLKPGEDTQISNIARYAWINDNCRVVGRLVVDTMFRSCGAAYRFLNIACRMHGFRILELQSSMSKHNPFAERAGFTMVKPMRSVHYEDGLKFMRKWFASHPADLETLMEEYDAMKPALQKRVEEECKRFYFDHSPLEKTGSRRHYSAGVVEAWPVRRTIAKIQGLCFTSPLYGYYRNPDVGRTELAEMSIPLLAFDNQRPDEPLRLDLL